jgi:hypothetical protein
LLGVVLIWFVGARRIQKKTAIAVNIGVRHGWAIPAPAGTRTRPITRLKATKVSVFGNTANAMIAAKVAVRPVPTMKLTAAA